MDYLDHMELGGIDAAGWGRGIGCWSHKERCTGLAGGIGLVRASHRTSSGCVDSTLLRCDRSFPEAVRVGSRLEPGVHSRVAGHTEEEPGCLHIGRVVVPEVDIHRTDAAGTDHIDLGEDNPGCNLADHRNWVGRRIGSGTGLTLRVGDVSVRCYGRCEEGMGIALVASCSRFIER